MKRNTGGIDISTVGRPGGVPTHITSAQPAPALNPHPAGQLIPGLSAGGVRTIDPFAFIGRARKALGRRLSG